MSDLFFEIQDELKREKLAAFFYKHRLSLIILAVILMLTGIIYPIYKHKQTQAQAELLNKYYIALEQKNLGKPEEILASLKQIYDSRMCTISDIAGLMLAQEYYKMQNFTESQKTLQFIAKSNCNKIISGFAEYLAINNSLNLDSNNHEFLTKLESLSKEVSVVNYRAMLLRATILVKNKAYEEAEKILENISQSDFITENIAKDAQILTDNIVYYKLVNKG